MSSLPIRRAQFKTADFAAWLVANGAEIAAPTNPYEVIRYRAFAPGSKRAITHVVYAKESGLLTYSGATGDHYRAFLAGESYGGMFVSQFDAVGKGGRYSGGADMRRQLLDRDGDECWFCGLSLGEDQTIEHLVPRSAGGANKLANYALAHRLCNQAAGDKPLVEKIAMRAALREQIA